MEESIVLMESCFICQKDCSKGCSICNNVFYCGVDHQKQDWKRHRKECILAKEVQGESSEIGRHLIATRDIKPGTHILTDTPISVAPTGSLPQFAKLCLSCSKVVTTDYKCTQCNWPMCGVECEKADIHNANECKIFKEHGVVPEPHERRDIYEDIHLLRCLLLREKDEKKWQQLMSLESHVEARKSEGAFVCRLSQQVSFIRDACKLDKFDFDTIDYISGVLSINTFEPRCVNWSQVPLNFECEARIYYNLSKLTHQCVSNVKLVDCSGGSQKSGITLVATIPIKKGEPLIQYYGSPEHGTRQRQRMQKLTYFFSCKCRRCADPTELGTYYSALRCTNSNCKNGYLLPSDPLDVSSIWNCTLENCDETMDSTEADKFVIGIIKETYAIAEEGRGKKIYFREHPEEGIKFVEFLEEKTKTLSVQKVHSNHFSLFLLKDCILDLLLVCIEPGKSQLILNIAKKIENWSLECLSVYDLFYPGLTPERGRYHYYISAALSLSMDVELKLNPGQECDVIVRNSPKLLETQQLALSLLSGMSEGSEARSMYSMLQSSILTTQQMLNSSLGKNSQKQKE